MIRASAADVPEISDFLHRHIAGSMFPLTNLLSHGIIGAGAPAPHPRAQRIWFRRQAGAITDVLALTDEGAALPQLAGGDIDGAVSVLRGRSLVGILGQAEQVSALRNGLGLRQARCRIDHDEPHFTLALCDLILPDLTGARLIPLSDAPRALVTRWCADYEVEALDTPFGEAQAEAARDIAAYLAKDSHRVLLVDDTPVAMTGFNATLPQAVQIGGVYTPPALRGRGHARAAVAMHLIEARAAGASLGILFAASAMAARAYTALGFRQIGHYNLTFFDGPQRVG